MRTWMKLMFAVTELCLWSVILANSVTWIEMTSLRNTLHLAVFPKRTVPTSVGCIAICTSTPGCNYVTYLSSTSMCYLHNKPQARQPIDNSRVWSKNVLCNNSFVYYNKIGVCLYIANIKATWYAARQGCESLDGRLIVANDKDQFKAVPEHYNGDTPFWVGGSTTLQTDSPPKLTWITGEVVELPLDDSSYFESGDTSGTEQCLALAYHYDLQKMTLRLRECDELSYFLCENI